LIDGDCGRDFAHGVITLVSSRQDWINSYRKLYGSFDRAEAMASLDHDADQGVVDETDKLYPKCIKRGRQFTRDRSWLYSSRVLLDAYHTIVAEHGRANSRRSRWPCWLAALIVTIAFSICIVMLTQTNN
jgi:hypothetical protein